LSLFPFPRNALQRAVDQDHQCTSIRAVCARLRSAERTGQDRGRIGLAPTGNPGARTCRTSGSVPADLFVDLGVKHGFPGHGGQLPDGQGGSTTRSRPPRCRNSGLAWEAPAIGRQSKASNSCWPT
jgi:hypothetical protein